MTLSESEIRVFTLPKVIKERSIGGEDTILFRQRRKGRSVRERIFAKKTKEQQSREGNLNLQRGETGGFGGGTTIQQ